MFTKIGVDSSFSGSEKLLTKGRKKIEHATKEPIFSLLKKTLQKILKNL